MPKIDDALRDRIDNVIDFSGRRMLSAADHAAWQVIHGILAYGHGLQLKTDKGVEPALDYLFAGGKLRGWDLKPGDHGIATVLELGSKSGQGHPDQWLGYLALAAVEEDAPVAVPGADRKYTFRDMITQAQWDVHDGMEASWTLMATSTYLPLDAKWKAKDGTEWTTERIIKMEAAEDLSKSACGGTHRLVGMTVALNRYLSEGNTLSGGWKDADEKIQHCVELAEKYQQPDGGFSTNFFDRAGMSADIGKRIHATGHTLEFVVLAMPDARLREPWVLKSVAYLCGLLEQTKQVSIECGALYHAARGLQLYRVRVFGEPTVAQTAESAPATAAAK